jgi:predicted MFS family arabinose efflux permease
MAVCAATALIVVGQFTAYTYITALIRRDAGFVGLSISAVLVVYGLAGVGGIAVIGRMVDRRLRSASGLAGAGVALALGVLAAAHGSILGTVGAVALWGAAFTALPVCLQSAVLRVAPDAGDAASALYVVAFQIGIGGGALAGSALVASGNLGSLPAVGMVLALAGTAVVFLAPQAFPSHRRRR